MIEDLEDVVALESKAGFLARQKFILLGVVGEECSDVELKEKIMFNIIKTNHPKSSGSIKGSSGNVE